MTAASRQAWQARLDLLAEEREMARGMGGATKVARQHAAGKLTVRERIGLLFDPGTFEEIGILADHQSRREDMRDFYAAADGAVVGTGEVHGRPTLVIADDFTVLGGSNGETGGMKAARIRELSRLLRAPLVFLLDGAGARANDGILDGWPASGTFRELVGLSGLVPMVAAVLGPAAGLAAVTVPLCDFKVFAENAGMLASGGPPLVEAALGMKVTKEELGGTAVHLASGVVDNFVADDAAAIAQVRQYLSYMPQSCYQRPPRVEPDAAAVPDADDLLDVMPWNRKQPYDMRKIIAGLADRGSIFELQPQYGAALITSLCRMDGDVVGVVGNQPLVRAGSFDAEEADKATHFIQVCNAFHIPMVFLADTPGFMVGPKAEGAGLLRRGMRVAHVLTQMRVPAVSVAIRKVYGMGGNAMNGIGNEQLTVLAWPTAEFGSLPVEGGVMAQFSRSIGESDDPTQARKSLLDEFRNAASVDGAARRFNFDELIDPRETRGRIVAAFRRVRDQPLEGGRLATLGIMP